MKGKEKCKALKEIRRQIAEANDIEFVVSECKHQGNCLGTCPKCEAELRYLERELAIRQGLGKAVAVVGISTSVCATMTACTTPDFIQDLLGQESTAGLMVAPEELEGDVAYPYPEESETVEDASDIALPESVIEVPGEIEGIMVAPETETMIGETEPETEWEIAGDIAILPTEEAANE